MIIAGIGTAIESSDIDETCNKDNNMLIRQNGTWLCTDDAETEEDLRFPIFSIGLRGASKSKCSICGRDYKIEEMKERHEKQCKEYNESKIR